MWLFLSLFATSFSSWSQTSLSGFVRDAETKEPLVSANVYVKNTFAGTVTEHDGSFRLQVAALPVTLVFSYAGFATFEREIAAAGQPVEVSLEPATLLVPEVVVAASRYQESYLEAPVTVEKLDLVSIRQAPSFDFYDELAKLKGLQATQSSLTFTSINAKGFTSIGNNRIVQLIDGMESAAPILNFPLGNTVGFSELDIHDVEVLPGAASALYGPNAFHGIILMNSKNPYDYQGLSAQVKTGFTHSDAAGEVEPLNSFAIRYAKAFNNRFAFKINLSALLAQDWLASDFTTNRLGYVPETDRSPNFDGVNTYGDESQIILKPANVTELSHYFAQLASQETGLPAEAIQPVAQSIMSETGAITRTGFKDKDLLDHNDARSLKGSVELHYRIKNNLEAAYTYLAGSGSTVWQGTDRFVIRDFTQQFHKVELKGAHFFVRGYTTLTDDGDGYTLTGVGGYANELFSPSGSEWVPTYYLTYTNALAQIMLGGEQPTEADVANAHKAARAAADAKIPQPGSAAFEEVTRGIRQRNLTDPNGGAGFYDKSKLWHTEFNYDLTEALKAPFDLQVGGNFRRFDLFTDGTILNEDPEGTGVNRRIAIDEFGAYVQLSKRLNDDRLRLTGSLRLDKNENFEAQVSPRLSANYALGQNRRHHLRGSFQTAFRSPDVQAQYLWFKSSDIEVGGTEANAGRYGLYEGGAYSFDSYKKFLQTGNSDDLETIYLNYVEPEQLTAYEVGYKALINKKLLLDFGAYFNIFDQFILQQNVVSKNPVTHQGKNIKALTVFRPYFNSAEKVTAWGSSLGWMYKLPKNFEFSGNYNYMDYRVDDDATYRPGFRAPKHAFNLGLGNRKIYKQFGVSVNFRWQEGYDHSTSTGVYKVQDLSTLDAQVSCRFPKIKTTVKLGGSNLLGKDYINTAGGVSVGSMYFLSLTFEQ